MDAINCRRADGAVHEDVAVGNMLQQIIRKAVSPIAWMSLMVHDCNNNNARTLDLV